MPLTEFQQIIKRDEPLAKHTWFGVGGNAEYFAEPRTIEELSALIQHCRGESIPTRLLGGGSNLLVRDEGVPGVVVQLSAEPFREIKVDGDRIIAGGGAQLRTLVSTAVGEGLAGLETLVGIPGTVGGALHGNAEGKGGDVGQWTNKATVMTKAGEIVERGRDEMAFAYRQSSLDELVILSGEFVLDRADPEELTRRMQKHWIVTKANQPTASQNAGCVFQNPSGMSAALLIEQGGLKGTRIGGAEISDQHANFMIAHAEATTADVLRLTELVRDRVSEKTGVDLELAIQIW
ncbi:MAG: UDP-N-acetylmuramate dehydrogenase [Planctomycetales bacterium]